MSSQSPDAQPKVQYASVVEGLHALRDKLMEMSLLLRDYQFEIDAAACKAAVAESDQLFDRVKARGWDN